ncbi:MAG: hypothetical protein GVX96_01860 [Bacteroidetes bacterium]|nr:hypothetical protein [Bacteroidota bacterium]
MLLEGLVKQKLSFVFKVGTALMLHLNSTRRLSIDIDIILPDKEANIDQVLQALIKEQGFTRYELHHRDKRSHIEKVHYKLFYQPYRKTAREEEYVLLDILFENICYSNLNQLPVHNHFLPQKGKPLQVDVASIEDLLGDKLAAFAPNTTGIPYSKGDQRMSMQIVKQLYDVGTLFDKARDLQVVKTTFKKFVKTELAYRNKSKLNIRDVTEDIFQTSRCLITRDKVGEANFKELQKGIQRISSFIFSESYHLEKAFTDASKAAYLATLLQVDADGMDRFDPTLDMNNWIIKQPFNTRINKLKKSNMEAFFYGYKMYELTTNNPQYLKSYP